VGLDALGLNGDNGHLAVALLESDTWVDLWGCKSAPLEPIIEQLDELSLSTVEKEHCLTVNLEGGKTLSISRPTHNTNAILSAQWISFVARLDPAVASYLQVLLGWLRQGGSAMDEEIFVHVAIFYLTKHGFVPTLESIVAEHRHLPAPNEYCLLREITLDTAARDFVEFVRTFDIANCYMNTYTGAIGNKSESADVEANDGLTVLHPYYSNITLLPFQ